MKRRILLTLCAIMTTASLLAACGSSADTAESTTSSSATEEVAASSEAEVVAEDAEETVVASSEAEAVEEVEESEEVTSTSDADEADVEESAVTEAALEDGVYTVDFVTDSSMFHINEALDGKATLTVENGEMTVHITLVSQNIVNLYPGTAEEAQEDDAVWLEPTVDEVTYSDGITEEVYGFDVPVPYLEDEFDLALVGKKNTWYDHKVYVTNPVPAEE